MGEFRGEELEALYRETLDNIEGLALVVVGNVRFNRSLKPDSEFLGGLLEAEEKLLEAKGLT